MTPPTSVTDSGGRGIWRRSWRFACIGAALVAIAAAAGVGYALASRQHTTDADRQAMAARAVQVMPFDLNATTHTFTKDAAGGVEQVVARDPADRRNITLIRQHLRKEADQFAGGNYSDPSTIHGAAMPGLRELQAGADRVQVHYEEVPSGARITYSSSDRVMVAALHAWFDAQNSDHAMPGMGMGH